MGQNGAFRGMACGAVEMIVADETFWDILGHALLSQPCGTFNRSFAIVHIDASISARGVARFGAGRATSRTEISRIA